MWLDSFVKVHYWPPTYTALNICQENKPGGFLDGTPFDYGTGRMKLQESLTSSTDYATMLYSHCSS
jgi:hypothetical protein